MVTRPPVLSIQKYAQAFYKTLILLGIVSPPTLPSCSKIDLKLESERIPHSISRAQYHHDPGNNAF